MQPMYLIEYINHMIRDLNNDTEFVAQGLHALYEKVSKKDSVDLQWLVAESHRASWDLRNTLRKLEEALDRLEHKDKTNNAGTEPE